MSRLPVRPRSAPAVGRPSASVAQLESSLDVAAVARTHPHERTHASARRPTRRDLARAVTALADALDGTAAGSPAPYARPIPAHSRRGRTPLATTVIEGSPLDLTAAAAHYARYVLDALRAEPPSGTLAHACASASGTIRGGAAA